MKKIDYRSFSTRFSFLALMVFMALIAPMQALAEQDESIQAQEEEVAQEDAGNAEAIAAGEALFKSNCAACHRLDSKGVGPALRGTGQKFERRSEERRVGKGSGRWQSKVSASK